MHLCVWFSLPRRNWLTLGWNWTGLGIPGSCLYCAADSRTSGPGSPGGQRHELRAWHQGSWRSSWLRSLLPQLLANFGVPCTGLWPFCLFLLWHVLCTHAIFFFKDCSNIDWGPSCPSMTSSRLCLPPSCFQIRPHSEMLDIRDTWRDAYQCHPLGTYFFSPNIPASSYLTAIFRWMSFPLWDSLPLLQRLLWQVSLFSYSINS